MMMMMKPLKMRLRTLVQTPIRLVHLVAAQEAQEVLAAPAIHKPGETPGNATLPPLTRTRLTALLVAVEPSGHDRKLQQIHLAFNCTSPLLQSSAFSCFYRVPFMTTASTPGTRPVYFPIPFSMTTPPRRTMAAIASQSAGESHSLPVYEGTPPGRRSSVASIASDPSTVSSASGTSLWSSGGSIASSSHTAPPSSSPSSPSGSHSGKSSAASILMRGTHMREPGSESGSTTGVAAAPAPADPAQNLPPKAIVVDRGGTILDIQLAESEEMNWIIWGGNLILEGLDFAVEHIRIVIKLADWERDSEKEGNISEAGTALLAEAKIYEYLAKVAPDFDITPHYYGVFNDSGSIALVLEDGGERLRRNSLETLDDSEKHELFEKAQQLHRLGILHGDLTERNILMGEDKNFRLIDFHVSQLDHKCSWNGSNGCGELEQFAEDLGMKL
ncbi:hypothetical protein GGU11DRAFT_591145 [Lentinula aff. detonsa]|nr:hypothetical protein GGU11DRAFT_591145 [Lentinula aff. detonsa]